MAADLSATSAIKFAANNIGGCKVIEIETPATADNTDTIAVTLADYGATKIKWIQAFRHSTTDSVVIDDDAPATVVSAGVLTITIGGSTADKKRVFRVGVE